MILLLSYVFIVDVAGLEEVMFGRLLTWCTFFFFVICNVCHSSYFLWNLIHVIILLRKNVQVPQSMPEIPELILYVIFYAILVYVALAWKEKLTSIRSTR